MERDGCGGIVYRGRWDEQIKRNGKRVNLQELEQVCSVVQSFSLPCTFYSVYTGYLTIIDLTMWPCVWQPTPKTADVTVTKIAGYVRVRIFMNQ